MVTACFVILTCLAGFNPADCAFNVNNVKFIRKHGITEQTTVDDKIVKESVEEVVKKFKQECGR